MHIDFAENFCPSMFVCLLPWKSDKLLKNNLLHGLIWLTIQLIKYFKNVLITLWQYFGVWAVGTMRCVYLWISVFLVLETGDIFNWWHVPAYSVATCICKHIVVWDLFQYWENIKILWCSCSLLVVVLLAVPGYGTGE